jgi:cellulose 1,4-beta-cellobiosidase
VNAEGDSPAAAVQVSTPPFPPAVPSSPEATNGPGSITLLWQGSAGATSYTVRRSAAPGGPHTVLKSGVSLTAYVDTAVTFGTTYYYTVSAVNSGGESAESDEVSGSPLPAPPAPPTNVKAKRPTTRKSVVTWTQSAGPDVAKNRIYRATAQAGPWTLVAEINPAKTYTNTPLAKKTAYYYQVTAVSSLGAESTRSNTAFVKKK